ncbi:MAG: DNA adenine methylase [Synergistaceae bacterium]|jgi:DNA adenine methylase|nr:DNA adenine methylase [Synergistaceae bacterium]
MNGKIPHIVQYQGSKRLLAPQILQYMPYKFHRLLEPFAGMAAITIAVAAERRAKQYFINDINKPIVRLLQTAINVPDELITKYTQIWNGQFEYSGGHLEHFYHIRDCFNAGEQTAENMLYLLARCVKGAVRYGKNGKFNQSPDKRRHGTNPQKVAENVYAIAALLKGKTQFSSIDYRQVLDITQAGDLVYMDPPYQGVSNVRDNRYYSGVDFETFSKSIEILNKKSVDYVISYDGECGGKGYGNDLPESLRCTKILLKAGISTQATLLGRKDTTFEALYLSDRLANKLFDFIPKQMTLFD